MTEGLLGEPMSIKTGPEVSTPPPPLFIALAPTINFSILNTKLVVKFMSKITINM